MAPADPDPASPLRLSVLLPVIGGPEAVATSLAGLDAQTIAGAIELLILTSRPERFAGVADDLPRLGAVRVLADTPEQSTGLCRARGVRQARADFVANAEDHCHPEPGWAAGMLAAFEPNVAAVCPDLRNGNQASRVATADHFVNFAAFKVARAGEDQPDLVGRNCCYRRQALLALGEELEPLMEVEYNLHARLRRDGWALRFAPEAVALHHDITDLRTALRFHRNFGRLLTARRAAAEHWSGPRIAAHAVGWPLIPALRLWRMRRMLARHRSEALRPTVLPTMLLLLTAAAVGELLGALGGAGNSAAVVAETEFRHG